MIGRMLSHYRIVEMIGAGGMGVVYKAHDERLDRDVAVKVLPSGTLADEHARKRFRKEALALSKLNHPNIATVFDFDAQEGVDFIVMELVEGASLAEKLKTGALPEKEISVLGAQIADALEEAHECGIVHRDLKPGNIALTPKGRVKVLDFGLARMLRPVSDEATTEALTEGLAVAGTLPYMSPEELRGERADHRSDLYSLGVVFYEMATSRRPFEHKVSTALADAIIHKPPEPPSTHNRKVSPGLESIILKALDKDPEHRYQSAREMRVDLERLIGPISGVVPKRKPIRAGRLLWVAAGAVAVIAILFALNVGGVRDWLAGGPGAARIESIAVLPLENLSGDPEQEYFADGMTEALIANLAKIPSLKVISRTSIMQYKRTPKPLPEIARELNVDAVVEGSVHQAGDRVRITTQLIYAAADQHLWAETYERGMSDILTLQSDIALAIAREIQVQAKEQERLTGKVQPVDPEAYKAYLKGLYAYQNQSAVKNSVRYLEDAIDIDPGYAPAYALLAFLYAHSYTTPAEAPQLCREAKMAATKAQELDDNLSEAHMSLGNTLVTCDWDWEEAKQELERAIELSPNSVLARDAYRLYLAYVGHFDEALDEINIILELEPLSPLYRRFPGWHYYLARRHEESILELQKLPEQRAPAGEPEWRAWPLVFLAMNYMALGRHEEALATCDKIKTLVPQGTLQWHDSTMACVYAQAGRRDDAQEILDDWTTRADREQIEPVLMAITYGALGYTDKALDWLTRGYENRSPIMLWLKVLPLLDPLRDDPRFQSILHRMNFPEQ